MEKAKGTSKPYVFHSIKYRRRVVTVSWLAHENRKVELWRCALVCLPQLGNNPTNREGGMPIMDKGMVPNLIKPCSLRVINLEADISPVNQTSG